MLYYCRLHQTVHSGLNSVYYFTIIDLQTCVWVVNLRDTRADHYFRFVASPEVEPTNNGSEREIRQVVIDRKVTQGTRSQIGMRWNERAWTMLATCQKQNRNVLNYLHQTIRANWLNQPAPALL